MPDAILTLDRKDRGRLECSDPRMLEAVRTKMSVVNPSYRFTPFGSPRLHAITALGTFKSGLAWAVLDAAREAAPASVVDVQDELKDEVEPLREEGIRLLPPVNPAFVYRDYQEEGATLALQAGRGIVILPTASGKSLTVFGISRSLIWHYNDTKLKILIIVPTIQLVEQFYKDFHDYGIDELVRPCKFCGALERHLDRDASVIIANRQWLEKHSAELPHIDAVIVDEVHSLKKDSKLSGYVQSMPAVIKLGCTGTLPDSKDDEWNIIGVVGPVLQRREIHEMQDAGYIAGIRILPVRVEHSKKPHWPIETLEDASRAFHREWKHIEAVEESNAKVAALASGLRGNTLVLFDHTDHGMELFRLMPARDKHFVNGDTDIGERERVRELMESTNGVVGVMNVKACGTGLNIKNVDNIVLAMFGKGTTKVIQAIGRGLRTRSTDKKTLLLVDVHHGFRYSRKHFEARKKLYMDNYRIVLTDADTRMLSVAGSEG